VTALTTLQVSLQPPILGELDGAALIRSNDKIAAKWQWWCHSFVLLHFWPQVVAAEDPNRKFFIYP
jgi:hypothetical protein